jgi:hypothetical protein
MGAAAYNRGTRAIGADIEAMIDHDRRTEEGFRLLAAADAAEEFCREVNTKLAEIQNGKGIAPVQQRAHLNCHVGQSRLSKYAIARDAWRETYGQRNVAFAALRMRKAAEFLMQWIP